MTHKPLLRIAISFCAAFTLAACDNGGDTSVVKSVESITTTYKASSPTINANGSGDSVMMWEEVESQDCTTDLYRMSRSLLKVRYQAAGAEWGSATALQTGVFRKSGILTASTSAVNSYVADAPKFHAKAFVDASGNAVAIWTQSDKDSATEKGNCTSTNIAVSGAKMELYTATYTKSSATWSTPVRLDTASGGVEGFVAGADAADNIVVAWTQNKSIAVSTETDRAGNSVATAAIYSGATKTWGTPTSLSASGKTARDIKLAVNIIDSTVGGDAMAIWRQNDSGDDYGLFAARYVKNSTWSAASQISDASVYVAQANVAIDKDGNATAVWSQRSGSDTATTIYANRFTASPAAWGTPVVIQSDNTATAVNEATARAHSPVVVVDSANSVLVAWTQEESLSAMANRWNNNIVLHVYANSYNAQSAAWGTSAQVDAETRLDADKPSVAVTANNKFFVSWRGGSASQHVYGRIFTSSGGFANTYQISSAPVIVNQLDSGRYGSAGVWLTWTTDTTITTAIVE